MNKRGIELSINFLVIMIISIVVFGMGIYFIMQIYQGGLKIVGDMDDKNKQMLWQRLEDNKVAYFPATTTASYNKPATINFGLNNQLNTAAGTGFSLYIRFNKYYNPDESEGTLTTTKPNSWIITTRGTGSDANNGLLLSTWPGVLPNNGKDELLIMFKPDKTAPKGTYVFDLIVAYDNKKWESDSCIDGTDTKVSCCDVGGSNDDAINNCATINPPSLYDGQINKIYIKV